MIHPHDDEFASPPSALTTLASDGGTVDESLEARYLRANVASRLFAASATPVRVGRFTVVEILGRGAMGVVVRAHDPQLDRHVAIKVLSSHDTSSPSRRARMLREAQAMAKLSHPNVVTVHEVGELDEGLFIAMELVEGSTLAQWLGERSRSWQEVRDIFVAAGRGLASAHAVGVLHRDFKPDNVMIGRDGRVRVMDFGLAHVGHGSHSSSDSQHEDDSQPITLTRSGELLGTPAYMAPEQFRGLTDARSDQFSFCVALFEALFGVRPFAGSSIVDLMWATANGEIRFPTRRPKIPAWLQRAVVRGLAPDPDGRHESMETLLLALRHDRVLGRRRAVLAVAGLLAAGTASVFAMLPSDSVCGGASAIVSGTWSATRKNELGEWFSKTGVPFAATTTELVTSHVDGLAARWVEVHTEVCERGVRREQSDDLLDRRMLCLDQQLRNIDASMQVLERADAEIVERAFDVVLGLPRADECLRSFEAMPMVPPAAVAEDTQRMRSVLAEADALERAGKWRESETLAREAVEHARSIGWGPLEAEALRSLGLATSRLLELEPATELLTDSFFLAAALGRHDLAAETAEHLVRVMGVLARFEEALTWGRHAELAVERAGDLEFQRARLEDAVGVALARAGRFEEAAARHTRAIAEAKRVLEPDDPRLCLMLSNSAQPLTVLGRTEEATQHLEHAVDLLEATVGPEHPRTASTLANLGIALKHAGRLEEALAAHQRALAIWEHTVGPDNPHRLGTLSNLGITLSELGRYEEALLYHREALTRTRTRSEPDPRLKSRVSNMGAILDQLGRKEEALALFEESLTLALEFFGPEHPETAVAHHNLGDTLGELGRTEEGCEHLERAVELRLRLFGPDHANTAHSLEVLAKTEIAGGRHDDALEHLTRALAIRDRDPATPAPVLLATLHGLASVQDALGRAATARETLQRAVALVDAHELASVTAGQARFDLARILATKPSTHEQAVGQARLALQLLRAAEHPMADEAAAWLKQHDR